MDTSKFEIGQSVSEKIEVTKDMSTNRTGSPEDDVLSTPAMLGLMEGVCISHSDPKLGADSATVGYAVDGLRHIARSDVGESVDVTATLIELDSERGRLTYEISVTQGERTIGKAVHKRAVISTS